MPISVTRGENKPPKDTGLLEKITELKSILKEDSVNSATRRYHVIIKLMNDNNFQVNMENKEFYMAIFYQTLLEQQVSNPKAF